jgi:photosystem II stability/assembly factor-like uncharacterized protein
LFRTSIHHCASVVFLLLLLLRPASAQTWRAMGPPGGDARTLAVDPRAPRVLYLGTTDGHIFGSQDGGEHWQILGRAGQRLDGVVTALVINQHDPHTLYASTWTRESQREGGGVYVSHDGGANWQTAGLEGHAVRALVQAPSQPEILVAGALDGVFRSPDAGANWQRISPEGHDELRNFDSLAIDPLHPEIIYAGTFHLPWKTIDGGAHWIPVHAGMIDDSDVLSLVVDRQHPRRVYASACSGIYRSDNGGAVWKKIQGIPFSARRTYVIRQDPRHPNTVYAGTSEGLWVTTDAGERWRHVASRDWVINALAIIPQENGSAGSRVVIGTEQLGVLASDDDAEHFHAANDGFYHRQILSVALDAGHSGRVLAILANAPEPVLATDDGGRTWAPLGPGLRTEGLKRVYASPTGWWAALERGGLMRYDAEKGKWMRAGVLRGEAAVATDRRGQRSRTPRSASVDLVVEDMSFAPDIWFAATSEGLLASRDNGETWSLFHFAPLDLPVSSVRTSPDGQDLRIVSLRGMVVTTDGGKTWSWHDLPFDAGGAVSLERADENTLLATAHAGLYISRDAGKSWKKASGGLPEVPLQDLALGKDVWLASMQTGGLFISRDRGASWRRVEGTLAEGYFPVVAPGEAADTIYAASATEGLYAIDVPIGAASATSSSSAR